MKKRTAKLIGYNVLLVLMVIGLIGGYISTVYMNNPSTSSSGGTHQTIQVELHTATPEDYDRLEQILPQNEIIQKLPDTAVLQISFYNFDTGSRTWERTYTLTKGNAVLGEAENPDITMVMSSRWLSILNANNFCSVIRSAKANNDFSAQTHLSTIKLAWKYKSIMSYKECLGL